MTSEEAQATFAELTRILNEQGLDWVVDSVRDDIQLGSLVEINQSDMSAVEFKSASELLQPSYRKAIRKSANFLVRKDYSPKEQLILLVDAIEDIVVQANACEDAVLTYFKETDGPPAIRFVSERRPSQSVVTEPAEIGRRSNAVGKLRGLLHELKGEVNS
jgi:hypothetical protein